MYDLKNNETTNYVLTTRLKLRNSNLKPPIIFLVTFKTSTIINISINIFKFCISDI